MKTLATIIFLSLLLPLSYGQQSQLYQYIPYIDARDSELGIEETGSGLLVGHERHRIYLATAYHVVAGMDRIDVHFQSDSTAFPATLVQHDRELDLAILFISATLDTSALDLINIKMEEDFTKGEPVFSIGHPFGEAWQLNDRNILLEAKDNLDPRLATITPEAIVPGCSGGPVFDLKEELIGLVLRENEIDAPCVRAYTIKKKLGDWRIPSNLILTNEEWWNALSSSWRFIFRNMVDSRKQKSAASSNIPPPAFFQELFATSRFECNNCELTGLSPLTRFTKLQEIVARRNHIRGIEPLTKMRRLRYLDLRNNDVKSLAPLAESYELEEIDLKNNRTLYDLSPLRELANLQKVNFTRTNIRTIEPLYNLNDLQSVKIFLADVPGSEIRFIEKRLPEVKIGFRYKREGMAHLIYLLTKPPRKEERVAENIDNQEDRFGKPLITPVYNPATAYYRSALPAYQNNKQEPAADTEPSNLLAGTATTPQKAASAQSAGRLPAEKASPLAYAEPEKAGSQPSQPTARSSSTTQTTSAYPTPSSTQEQRRETPAPTSPAPPAREAIKPQPKPAATTTTPENPTAQATAPQTARNQPEARQPRPTPRTEPMRKPKAAVKPATRPQQAQAAPATISEPQAPSTAEAHEEKLRQLLLGRKPSETERLAFQWLGENPDNHMYRAYVVLGRVYQGKYDKARELWFFFKDKTLNDGQNFTDKVVAEIDRLEQLGATNSGIKKFRNQIAAD